MSGRQEQRCRVNQLHLCETLAQISVLARSLARSRPMGANEGRALGAHRSSNEWKCRSEATISLATRPAWPPFGLRAEVGALARCNMFDSFNETSLTRASELACLLARGQAKLRRVSGQSGAGAARLRRPASGTICICAPRSLLVCAPETSLIALAWRQKLSGVCARCSSDLASVFAQAEAEAAGGQRRSPPPPPPPSVTCRARCPLAG